MQSVRWTPKGSGVRAALAATDWSKTLLGPLEKWPRHWREALTGATDPGPGRRSGQGTATIVPFLVLALASKVEPGEQPDGRDG